MDTCWEYMNYRAVLGEPRRGPWLPLSAVAGTVALAMQGDSLRQSSRSGTCSRGDLALSLAELLWVLGNVVWMLEDLLSHGHLPSHGAVVMLLVVGDILAVCA